MKNKWLILIAFVGVALTNQMLWLNFSPLITFLQEKYTITEDVASLMMLIFPVAYVFLSIHAGGMIDKKGYKKTIVIGSVIMTIGAAIRVFENGNFWILFGGHTLIAIAQPYIINGISKLVADWFDEKDAAGATGIGTAGMFLGMAFGAALTPMLLEAMGYQGMLGLMAGISLLTTLFFAGYVKENNKAGDVVSTGSFKDFGQLLKIKNIVIINILSFLALGFFNGLTGWIEPILAEQSISKDDAGLVGGLLIFGGIIGAAIIPMISDKIKKRKPFIIFGAIVATALAYPLMTGNNMGLLLALGGVIGLLFLPGYPLLIAASEEEAGKSRAGASTGLLMLSGNLGGIIVIIGMQMLKGEGTTWLPAVYCCVAVVAIAIPFALMMKETGGKRG